MSPPAPCRHCQARPATRPRRLCRACYADPGTRGLYPPGRFVTAAPAVKVRHGRRPLGRPCPAPPGSPEKLAALADRLERGEALWHPGDGGADDDLDPGVPAPPLRAGPVRGRRVDGRPPRKRTRRGLADVGRAALRVVRVG